MSLDRITHRYKTVILSHKYRPGLDMRISVAISETGSANCGDHPGIAIPTARSGNVVPQTDCAAFCTQPCYANTDSAFLLRLILTSTSKRGVCKKTIYMVGKCKLLSFCSKSSWFRLSEHNSKRENCKVHHQ